jgi:Plasmid encoded RepA protein
MSELAAQLELLGLDETRRRVVHGYPLAERRKMLRRVETMHEVMSALPAPDDLSFLHSGLCQTCLPHNRPEQNHKVWSRRAGRFSLTITPGVIDETYVGVPYGSKARLILIHLQTEGVRSRTVNLGPSLSAFLRSLGLPVTGGPRGSIGAVREQCLRIARCTFSMQWTDRNAAGDEHRIITDTRIARGLDLWRAAKGDGWSGLIELTEEFYDHLRNHAVPLDKRGISHLAGNSLGLDLYTMFAYRLPKLSRDTHVRWESLQGQIGANYDRKRKLAESVRRTMPDVITAYPHARVEVTTTGLTLKPSQPAVPRPIVNGFRVIEA